MDEKEAEKKRSHRNEKLKAKRASESEEQRKERLRIRLEKDRERRRTKKLQDEKIRSSETKDHEEQHLATLKRLKLGVKVIRNIDHQLWSASLILHRSSEARPPPNHLGLDFHIIIYMYTYVRTFLIRVRVLVICDRNSIATKREEFPAQVVEVASSRLHFASLAHLLQLLQQTYPALCQQPAWNSVLVHYYY